MVDVKAECGCTMEVGFESSAIDEDWYGHVGAICKKHKLEALIENTKEELQQHDRTLTKLRQYEGSLRKMEDKK